MEDVDRSKVVGLSRRQIAAGASWAIPVLAVAAAAPAFASSYSGDVLAACPDVGALNVSGGKLASAGGDQWTLTTTMQVPNGLLSNGYYSPGWAIFTFDANPYPLWNGATELAPGATTAPGFELTGAGIGASLVNDYHGGVNPDLSFVFASAGSAVSVPFSLTIPGSSGSSTSPINGCTSFQFQIGYYDSIGGPPSTDPDSYANVLTTVPPIPQYCSFYWNGCFDSAGNASSVSLTSTPAH